MTRSEQVPACREEAVPAPTGVFDLPPRQAAKAASELIGGDEQHLRRVAASMAHQVADLELRIGELRRSPGGTGRGAMDRNLEIHRLSDRLRLLRRFGVDLCLGRMVDARGERVYVGRLGLSDPDGVQLLVDWRTPAAEPFFAATPAHPMGLVSRRRYRWTQGRLTDYSDEVLDPGADLRGLVLDEDSTFIASLGSSRSARMRDVLSTLQADQDRIVRTGSRGALVVDGGPGTGKTVVALHRAAYLLHADPRLSEGRGGVLFVGPHRPYLAYIADVLPGLGEEGVQTCTIGDLVAEGVRAVPEPDPEVARLKSSLDLVGAIEPAVALYEEPPRTATLIQTDWADAWLSPEDWAEAFAAVEDQTPHNEALEEIRDQLTTIMIDHLTAEQPGEDLDGQTIDQADEKVEEQSAADVLRRALRASPELNDALRSSWTLVEPTDLVGDLWSVPAYLRRCAPALAEEDVQRLQRPDAQAWTVSDLPLLDAARRRLGDPGATRRRRRREVAAAAERSAMDQVVEDLLAADDDPESSTQLLRRDSIRDALVDDDATPEETSDRLAGPFAHVVVDEAQELTDAEWQMLRRRCPSGSFTVVGDRAQARRGFSESWETRLHRVGLSEIQTAVLEINYRTPQEIMVEAEPEIRAVLPDANVPTSIRRGGLPVRHGRTSEVIDIVQRWSNTHPEGLACVIGDPGFAATSRVLSLTPELAKGLEFDLVVLVDPHRLGTGVAGAVDRYVAMTRATQQLVLLTSD